MKKLKRIMMAFLALMTMLTAGFGFIGCNKEEEHPADCTCAECQNEQKKYDTNVRLISNLGEEWTFLSNEERKEDEYEYDGKERKISIYGYQIPELYGDQWFGIHSNLTDTFELNCLYTDVNGVQTVSSQVIVREKGKYNISCVVGGISDKCKFRSMYLEITVK